MTLNEIIESRGNDTIYYLGLFTILSSLVMLLAYIKVYNSFFIKIINFKLNILLGNINCA